MSENRTHTLKSLLLAACLSAVVFTSVRAQLELPREGFFDVRSAATTMIAGVHELEARLQLILSAEALDALNSGVPLTIELNLEVIRVRGLWLDAVEAELTVTYELEYRPLSQRYIVRNLNSGDENSFSTLYSALNNLGRIQGLPVIDDALLDPGSAYRMRLRALLSTRQYPAPLRILFFWRSQWQLKSDWYEWTLER
ncbi:MAG: DUF4390 domain-containing protein [Proteobacteria bacterium]|nr:DUF4390 domain-containing protein [Pseudomonadota bacterium]